MSTSGVWASPHAPRPPLRPAALRSGLRYACHCLHGPAGRAAAIRWWRWAHRGAPQALSASAPWVFAGAENRPGHARTEALRPRRAARRRNRSGLSGAIVELERTYTVYRAPVRGDPEGRTLGGPNGATNGGTAVRTDECGLGRPLSPCSRPRARAAGVKSCPVAGDGVTGCEFGVPKNQRPGSWCRTGPPSSREDGGRGRLSRVWMLTADAGLGAGADQRLSVGGDAGVCGDASPHACPGRERLNRGPGRLDGPRPSAQAKTLRVGGYARRHALPVIPSPQGQRWPSRWVAIACPAADSGSPTAGLCPGSRRSSQAAPARPPPWGASG